MKKLILTLFYLLLGIFCFSQSASIEKKIKQKIAIVIGVANYQYADQLRNTLNDAIDMAQKLSDLGFNVQKILDPDLKEMTSAIDGWGKKIIDADVSLFYYSGHGAELNNENYIFPKNSNPTSPSDLKYEAYPVGRIIGKIEFANAKTNILILDACRNNPFTKNWSKAFNQVEGLANIDAPNGMFIGFAASPGKTASDGAGRNGTYTAAILKFINYKNITIDQLFNKVNKEVRSQSEGKQIPFKNSSLDDDFYFVLDNTQPIGLNQELPEKSAEENIKVTKIESKNIKGQTNYADIYYRKYKVENKSKLSISVTLRLPYGSYKNCIADLDNFILEGYWKQVKTIPPFSTEYFTYDHELKSEKDVYGNFIKCAGISIIKFDADYIK